MSEQGRIFDLQIKPAVDIKLSIVISRYNRDVHHIISSRIHIMWSSEKTFRNFLQIIQYFTIDQSGYVGNFSLFDPRFDL